MNFLVFRFLFVVLLTTNLWSCASLVAEKTDLEHITQTENILLLQQRMAAGKLSAVELTEFYIERINRLDKNYNSVIMINPNALSYAQQLDKERAKGNVRSSLHGIPILLKDNIETIDMPTTAGSLALKNNITKRDAPLVDNLRKAGAIILGKANLSEWANIRSERSSSGWSAIGGQTRNPHDSNRSPCGSSSGSGAAVAANFAVAAIGTETNGSITCPASMNGVVGVKPTVGMVSRTHIVPISHTQDTAGPMAKNVVDAAILLQFMSSADQLDEKTLESDIDRSKDLTPNFNTNSLSDLRVGFVNSSATRHESVKALENNIKNQLATTTQSLKSDLAHSPYPNFYGETYTVLLYQLKHTLNEYFASLPNDYQSLTLEKLIAFNRDNREQEMQYFLQEIFLKSQEKGPLSEDEYKNALARITEEAQSSLKNLMNDNQVDVLLAISRGPAWSIDIINGDSSTGGVSTYSAVSGYPHITIPLGRVHNMPIGLSIMGLKGQEKKLLQIAYELEQLINFK